MAAAVATGTGASRSGRADLDPVPRDEDGLSQTQRGASAGEGQRLRDMGLRLEAYPGAFDWRAYARPRAGSVGEDRWRALEHLLKAGLGSGLEPPVRGEGAASFYGALGAYYLGKDDLSAAIALERAGVVEGGIGGAREGLATAYYRLGRFREALPLFKDAAGSPSAEVGLYVDGADAAVKLGRFQAAFALLAAGRDRMPGHPSLASKIREVVESYFQRRTSQARRLYGRAGGRARADRLVARIAEQSCQIWNKLDPVSGAGAASPDGKVVILANYDIGACADYRVEQKRELFRALGRPCEIYRLDQWEAFVAALPGAAAAIIYRLPAWPSVTRAILAARGAGVLVYYDVDDLVFDAEQYPEPLGTYGELLTGAEYEAILFGVPLFRLALGMCDCGIASTRSLARAMTPLVRTGQVFWLPNGLDSRNEPYVHSPPKRTRTDDAIWIAYASGTKAHNTDFVELAAPALLEALKRRHDVRLLLVGHLALPESFDDVRDQVIRFDFIEQAETYWSILAEADVSLAVLKPNWAAHAKSEIKWLEAGVLGIPSIVSDTETYREVLEHRRDALVVRTVEEWREALDLLLSDAGLRASIGRRAREKAATRYSITANARRLEALLAPALSGRG